MQENRTHFDSAILEQTVYVQIRTTTQRTRCTHTQTEPTITQLYVGRMEEHYQSITLDCLGYSLYIRYGAKKMQEKREWNRTTYAMRARWKKKHGTKKTIKNIQLQSYNIKCVVCFDFFFLVLHFYECQACTKLIGRTQKFGIAIVNGPRV